MINFKENPTNADELLYLLYLGGYQIKVEGDRLIVTPAHAIDEELAELIKKLKSDLIQVIKKGVVKD